MEASPNHDYEKLWRKVEIYELKGLPKSASEVVNSIYDQAKREKESAQIIKALIYQSKFSLTLEENAELKLFKRFQAEIEEADGIYKSLLQNKLAEILTDYYKNNRYVYQRRAKTEEKINIDDFRTWNESNIQSTILQLYESSLENKTLLEETELEKVSEFILKEIETEVEGDYKWSIYDLFSENYISFLNFLNLINSDGFTENQIKERDYFVNFHYDNLSESDKFDSKIKILKLYKDRIHFHVEHNQDSEAVSWILKRLDFVYSQTFLIKADTYYVEALKDMIDQFGELPISNLIKFKLANFYVSQKSSSRDSSFQQNYQLAHQLLSEILKDAADLKIGRRAEALKKEIEKPYLEISLDRFIPQQTPSRIYLDYRNLDGLTWNLLQSNDEFVSTFSKVYNGDKIRSLLSELDLIKSWNTELINLNDFNGVAMEDVLPPLEYGSYILVGIHPENEEIIGYKIFNITDLAIITQRIDDSNTVRVVDRLTGSPLNDVSLKFVSKDKKNKYEFSNQWFSTDDQGKVEVKYSNIITNIDISLKVDSDSVTFNPRGFFDRGSARNQDKIQVETDLFFDRQIYRPSQKVLFKGIVYQGNDISKETSVGEKILLTLYDPNLVVIDQKEFETNEFGSFSGEFILPDKGLNGVYRILSKKADSKDMISKDQRNFEVGNFFFHVEEYKRPNFEIIFDPIKARYSVSDSITVSGNITAFSGAGIDNSTLKYTVFRRINLNREFYLNYPRARNFINQNQEIYHGQVLTAKNGNFSFDFLALPIEEIEPEYNPNYTYEVKVEVTDPSGETNSSSIYYNVAYHTLKIVSEVPAIVYKNSIDQKIEVYTTNLNGNKVPAELEIEVFKIQSPDRVLIPHNRTIAPDFQRESKEEFEEIFPYEFNHFYDTISKNKIWSTRINTANNSKIDLDEIKPWEEGKYVVKLYHTDSLGHIVKEEKEFEVIEFSSKNIADNQLFFLHTDKTSYSPNEKVKLKFGSAADLLHVFMQVEQKNQIVAEYHYELSNEVKFLEIPTSDKDLGGMHVHYQYVFANSAFSESKFIPINAPRVDLRIETLSFRDKLLPGQTETWTFKISQNNKRVKQAELLAGMYDLSLDKLSNSTNRWGFEPFENTIFYSRIGTSLGDGFTKASGFLLTDRYWINTINPNLSFIPNFDWFGFSISPRSIKNTNYRARLSEKLYQNRIQTSKDSKIPKGVITGIVTDILGDPLESVRVGNFESKAHTSSDKNGFFQIKAENGHSLTFHYPNYLKDTVKITDFNSISIALLERTIELEGVNVIGYLSQNKREIKIRGSSSLFDSGPVYEITEDVQFEESIVVNNEIETASSSPKDLSSEASLGMYPIQYRSNLNETAFFLPHLNTNRKGEVAFSFDIPESLTSWKLMLLAHDKNLNKSYKELKVFTQKELMISPNFPRFLREGDQVTLKARIDNFSKEPILGKAKLILSTPDGKDSIPNQNFENVDVKIQGQSNATVSWDVLVPSGVDLLAYKVSFASEKYSDGEKNVLPILSKRILMTETMSLWANRGEIRNFSFEKLKNNQSSTLESKSLSFDLYTNPIWHILQSFPFIDQLPKENSEQLISKIFVNSIGIQLIKQNDEIRNLLESWRDSSSDHSNLNIDDKISAILLQESPWVKSFESDEVKKEKLARLLDTLRLKDQIEIDSKKLAEFQKVDGSFAWFKGSRGSNIPMTMHVLEVLGKLSQLDNNLLSGDLRQIAEKALEFVGYEMQRSYKDLLNRASEMEVKEQKEFLNQNWISLNQLNALYLKVLFNKKYLTSQSIAAEEFYLQNLKKHASNLSLYRKAKAALIFENSNDDFYRDLIMSIYENSIQSEEMGVYWAQPEGFYSWNEDPIGTHASFIEVFSFLGNRVFGEEKNQSFLNEMKKWLIKNKQTTNWTTSKSTVAAIAALLINDTKSDQQNKEVTVTVGNQYFYSVDPTDAAISTGYLSNTWGKSEIKSELSEVKIQNDSKEPVFGGVYWQYLEEIENISNSGSHLNIEKSILLKSRQEGIEKFSTVNEQTQIEIGDLVKIRLEVRVDRDVDYIYIKDQRASGLEPTKVLSGFKYQNNVGYYASHKDASSHFYFESLKKGVHVFEYELRASQAGEYSGGIAQIQSYYAPEFSSQARSKKIVID
ncbi:hypothetical protein GCM10026987_37160 [Belliella aquatica]|uniref:Alpha-2-macroglobulin domain-containing protein n=1 Tax=Belliella aquatica TaxID=1323734 RepID=A0ABQ1N271_9BACT|nr:hypothetical protein GCM10010993_30100 [Belliella aquatica]